MKKSLSDKLDKQTIELGFPRYSSFKAGYALATKLCGMMCAGGIDKAEESEKNALFLTPDIYLKKSRVDSNLYRAFSTLNLALFSVSELYGRNGIKSETLFDDNKLTELIPDDIRVFDIQGLGKDAELEDLCRGFTIPILESIGDRLYHLNGFDSRKTNPDINKFMKQQIREISKYAKLGIDASKVIKGFGLPLEASALNTVSESLTHPSELWDALHNENLFTHFQNFLGLNAQLNKLTLQEGFVYDFKYLLGHEITETMNFAQMVHFNNILLDHNNLSKTKEIAFPFQGQVFYSKKFSADTPNTPEDRVYIIGSLIENSLNDQQMPFFPKHFFNGLGDRLTALGVSSEQASKIRDYFRYSFVGGHTHTKSKFSMTKEEVLSALLSEEREEDIYPQALSKLVTLVTGQNPFPVSYKFFSEKEGFDNADGIRTISYITELNPSFKEKIEIIEEKDSSLDAEQELFIAQKKFKTKNTDILIRPNVGACFVLDVNATGDIFNPFVSTIDVREAYEKVLPVDEVAHKLLNLEVDVHEMIHAAEIDSRLIWRNFANYVGAFYLDAAMKNWKRLDTECSTTSLQQTFRKSGKRTWREMIVDNLDEYVLTALGTDKLAAKMRQYGTDIGMLKAGLSPINEDKTRDMEKLREILVPSLEDSLSTKLYWESRKALLQQDRGVMEQAERKALDTSNELSSICETMTEAYAYIACQDIIENGLGGLSREDKSYYGQSLLGRLLERGVQAESFIEIAHRFPKKQWNKHLLNLGLKYERVISPEQNNMGENNLIELGYNPLNPFEAYEDIEELQVSAEKASIPFDNVLTRINSAKALLGLRYSSRIPLIFDFIYKHGKRKGFEKLLNMESWEDIEKGL